MDALLNIGGYFGIQVLNKDGEVKNDFIIENGWTNEGLKHLMDRTFKSTPPSAATFYLGLMGSSPSLSPDDTMASHSGWTENADYSNSTRPAWGQDDPAGESGDVITTTNTTLVQFAVNASSTFGGAFISTDSTKGGSGSDQGTLIATGLFSGDLDLTSGDVLKVYYTLKAQAA